MDILKKEIAILRRCSGFKEIEKQLQMINKLIVTNYMFELSNGVRIYPIEVEAYDINHETSDQVSTEPRRTTRTRTTSKW